MCLPVPPHDASGSDTTCDADLFYGRVRVGNTCVSCPAGTTNAAGDDASGSDTTCDVTTCGVNQFVSTNVPVYVLLERRTMPVTMPLDLIRTVMR